MTAKSARREARLAAALKANLKRRKAGASKAPLPLYKEKPAAPSPHPGPNGAVKQG